MTTRLWIPFGLSVALLASTGCAKTHGTLPSSLNHTTLSSEFYESTPRLMNGTLAEKVNA